MKKIKVTIEGYKSKIHTLFGDEEAIQVGDTSGPYIEYKKIETIRRYNPNYGDDRICMCGHPYYRHFDTYEDMEACGCKYCRCNNFKEKETDGSNK